MQTAGAGFQAAGWGGTYQEGRATPSQGAIQVDCHFGVGNGGPGDDVALVVAAVHCFVAPACKHSDCSSAML